MIAASGRPRTVNCLRLLLAPMSIASRHTPNRPSDQNPLCGALNFHIDCMFSRTTEGQEKLPIRSRQSPIWLGHQFRRTDP
jgi:hypothetical protein